MEAMGCSAAFAITLFLAALVPITVINGGVQMVIYFPIKSSSRKGSRKTKLPTKGLGTGRSHAAFLCTHGTKSVLSLGTQHHKAQQKLVETISFNELLSALF